MEAKRIKSISKTLSWLLRHGAPQFSELNVTTDGFIKVNKLLETAKNNNQLSPLKSITYEELEYVVNNNEKNRFYLDKTENEWKIRANQGHSFPVPDLDLEEVDYKMCPYTLHGTDNKSWKLIQETGFLSRMSREYIHMTEENSYDKLGKSKSPIVLKINVASAIKDGIKFYKSKNGVVLTKGIDGKLPLKYVTCI